MNLPEQINQILGKHILDASDLIEKKGLTGRDAQEALMYGRLRGLEASIQEVAVEVEKLKASNP